MKLVALGSTGGTGLQIVHQAMERKHDVVAFVRDPSRPTASSPRLHVFKGDVLHADAVV